MGTSVVNGNEGSWRREDKVLSLAQGRWVGKREAVGETGSGSLGLGAIPWSTVAANSGLCPLTADLAECKLVSFPIGIYKVLRNVTDRIHLITLANNELKSLTSKFMTTFCQLRGRPGGHSGSHPEGSDPLWGLSPGLVPWSASLREEFPRRAFKGGPVSSLQPGYLPYL